MNKKTSRQTKATLALACALAGSATAQTQGGEDFHSLVTTISLQFDSLKASDSDSSSRLLNARIAHNMEELLTKHDSTFYAPLTELPYLGKCYSNDGELRLYTWNYPLQDKTHGYGGYIQCRPTKRSRKQHPIALTTSSEAYIPKEGERISPANWYGALYYKAIKAKKDGQDYYLLLGWCGNDALSDAKIVETLKISQNKKTATFGGTRAFLAKKKSANRVVLQYNSSAKVTVDYNDAEKRIVMDHLSPSEPFYKDIYSYYGPDFSYDAYAYDKKTGQWRLEEDIDQKNKE